MSLEYTKLPLPQNWEQKFDIETRRVFYLDHLNQITTWVDPRIEIYNTNQAVLAREKKAKAIHEKFPKFTLAKISESLSNNHDNVSSVEILLQTEQKLIEQFEQGELKKRKAEEKIKAEKERQEALNRQKLLDEEKAKAEKEKREKEKQEKEKQEKEKREKEKQEKEKQEALEKQKRWLEAEEESKQEMESHAKLQSINETKTRSKLNLGPNKALYNGPNPSIRVGPGGGLAKGPDPANLLKPLRSVSTIQAT